MFICHQAGEQRKNRKRPCFVRFTAIFQCLLNQVQDTLQTLPVGSKYGHQLFRHQHGANAANVRESGSRVDQTPWIKGCQILPEHLKNDAIFVVEFHPIEGGGPFSIVLVKFSSLNEMHSFGHIRNNELIKRKQFPEISPVSIDAQLLVRAAVEGLLQLTKIIYDAARPIVDWGFTGEIAVQAGSLNVPVDNENVLRLPYQSSSQKKCGVSKRHGAPCATFIGIESNNSTGLQWRKTHEPFPFLPAAFFFLLDLPGGGWSATA